MQAQQQQQKQQQKQQRSSRCSRCRRRRRRNNASKRHLRRMRTRLPSLWSWVCADLDAPCSEHGAAELGERWRWRRGAPSVGAALPNAGVGIQGGGPAAVQLEMLRQSHACAPDASDARRPRGNALRHPYPQSAAEPANSCAVLSSRPLFKAEFDTCASSAQFPRAHNSSHPPPPPHPAARARLAFLPLLADPRTPPFAHRSVLSLLPAGHLPAVSCRDGRRSSRGGITKVPDLVPAAS